MRGPLILLLLLTLANGILWSNMIPPLFAPDETRHFLYAQDMSGEPGWRLRSAPKELTLELALLARLNGFHNIFRWGHLPEVHSLEGYRREFRDLAGDQRRVEERVLLWHPQFRRYHPPLYYAASATIHHALSDSPVKVSVTLV